ncbi:MAG: hypothetical protein ACYC37_00540 [Desulfobacteria bacterium]
MEIWISQSNPGKQTMLSIGCAIVGLLLVIGFRNFSGSDGNTLAGFLSGMLLLLIGVLGILLSGKQTVTVNPKTRSITVEDSNRFWTKKRLIPFSAVVGVSIGYLGKRSNFVSWYFLVLKLRGGEEYSLFPPGRFFEGGSERSTVASWKERLEAYFGQESKIERTSG